MINFKKKTTYLVLFFSIMCMNLSVFAQDFSLLPKAGINRNDCTSIMKDFDIKYQNAEGEYNSYKRFNNALNAIDVGGESELEKKEGRLLGCGVITGRIRLYFWKPYVAYLIQNLSILAGALSMLFITLGGYQYFLAMVSGEDSNAKNTVKNAILGLVISFSSWIIVEIVQSFVSF